ncbi:MAG TPA: hypothetical protein VMY87_06285 [Armatimonadota bacterium]|nr:hypothetical protein [Armatimonadota bacterium]
MSETSWVKNVSGEDIDDAPEEELAEAAEPVEGDTPDEAPAPEPAAPDEAPAESEPEGEPAPEPVPDPAQAGLIRDLQEERARRQAAEDRLARLDAAKPPEAQAPTAAPPAEEASPFDQLDDDDLLTVGEFRRLETAKQQKAEREGFEQNLAQSEARAVAEYTKDSAGEGLDYASVINAGGRSFTPGDRFDIAHSHDPAKLAYERAIERTPELRQRALMAAVKKALQEMSGETPAPATRPPAGQPPPKRPLTQRQILGPANSPQSVVRALVGEPEED